MRESGDMIWLIGCLILVGTSLAARRIPMSLLLKSVLGWAAVIAVVAVIVGYRSELHWFADDLGARLGFASQRVDGERVRVTMADDGHFWVQAQINGVSRRMLVDSGATTTSLSEATARAAGIDYKGNGMATVVQTANGEMLTGIGRVKEFGVGPLRTNDLEVLISPNFGETDMVGMNFLSRLGDWRTEGQTLILEPRGAAASGSGS